VLEQFTTAKI